MAVTAGKEKIMDWETQFNVGKAHDLIYFINELFADDEYLEEKVDAMEKWNAIYDTIADAGKKKMDAMLDEFVDDPYTNMKKTDRCGHRFDTEYIKSRIEEKKHTYYIRR